MAFGSLLILPHTKWGRKRITVLMHVDETDVWQFGQPDTVRIWDLHKTEWDEHLWCLWTTTDLGGRGDGVTSAAAFFNMWHLSCEHFQVDVNVDKHVAHNAVRTHPDGVFVRLIDEKCDRWMWECLRISSRHARSRWRRIGFVGHDSGSP